MGEEPSHTTARKPGPVTIIQYSLGRMKEEAEGLGMFRSKWLRVGFEDVAKD